MLYFTVTCYTGAQILWFPASVLYQWLCVYFLRTLLNHCLPTGSLIALSVLLLLCMISAGGGLVVIDFMFETLPSGSNRKRKSISCASNVRYNVFSSAQFQMFQILIMAKFIWSPLQMRVATCAKMVNKTNMTTRRLVEDSSLKSLSLSGFFLGSLESGVCQYAT